MTTKVEESGEHVIFGSGKITLQTRVRCLLMSVSYAIVRCVPRRAVHGLRNARFAAPVLRHRSEGG